MCFTPVIAINKQQHVKDEESVEYAFHEIIEHQYGEDLEGTHFFKIDDLLKIIEDELRTQSDLLDDCENDLFIDGLQSLQKQLEQIILDNIQYRDKIYLVFEWTLS